MDSFFRLMYGLLFIVTGAITGYNIGKKTVKPVSYPIERKTVHFVYDTLYSTDTIHDTVVKIKRVYIEKEPFKSNIPSTILFKKE